MHRHPMRSTFALAIAVAFAGVLALGARPAAAAAPSVQFFHDEFLLEPVATCDGFVILSSGSVDVRVTTSYDQAGNPVRLQIFHSFTDSLLTNSVTGFSVPDRGHDTATIDLVTGETSIVGLTFQTTIPGQGTVAKTVGLIIFEPDGNVVIRGPHEVNGEVNYDAVFCPILAQG
jgi:hypothetical protein